MSSSSESLPGGSGRKRLTENALGRVALDEVERAPPGVVRRVLELLLSAVEEAVGCAFILDQLDLLARLRQGQLQLDVVLVADGLVGAALEREDRRFELWHELDHPARPAIEADGA